MTAGVEVSTASLAWTQDPVPDARTILAALPAGVLVVDMCDVILCANSAAEALLGRSVAQLSNTPLSAHLPSPQPLFDLLQTARDKAICAVHNDTFIKGPAAEPCPVSVRAQPIAEFGDGAVLIVITHEGAAHALGRQVRQRQVARSFAGLASMLGHEIRNPLAGIRGAAELLEAQLTGNDRQLAVLIRDEADRVRALADCMSEMTERPVHRQPVNIHRVLDHVRRLAEAAVAPSIRFVEKYDPSLPAAAGDHDLLVQVILNLVTNAAEAIRASGVGGEITLLTAYRHGFRRTGLDREVSSAPLLVTIRDDGPGVPRVIEDRLFEPFVTSKRPSPSGSRTAPSGLGLAIAAKLIDDLDGTIDMQRVGRWTEFRVALPIWREESGD